MVTKRTLIVASLVVVLVAGAASPVAARVESAAAPPVAAVEVGSSASVVQQDWGGILWGLILQGIAGGILDSGESVMNSAIASGPDGLFWYQVGKAFWDFGCELGRAGEALVPGVPPTFPFRCTLYPQWPY